MEKPISLFLVHRETGQRYPIRGNVLIGRSSGDIVFSRDLRLSQQHCRVSPGKDGLVIHDLNSANGTLIDGKRLTPDRPYWLKPGSELALGNQVFSVETVSLARRVVLRKALADQTSGTLRNWFSALAIIAICCAGSQAFWPRIKSPATPNPQQTLQREIGEIYGRYFELRASVDRRSAPVTEIVQRMQIQVLIHLNLVATKLAAIPIGNGRDRQILELERQLVSDLTNHATAEIRFLTTADLTVQEEIDRLDDQLTETTGRFRTLVGGRGPAAAFLPAQIQSPLQLVEREMRQALAAYRRLGDSVRRQKVSEQRMVETIDQNLIPKLNAVAVKLSVVKPDNEGERQRMNVEIKLVPALIGQLKSLSSFTVSHDAKSNAEMERWSAQIEKLNSEIKNQILRQPAAR